MVAWRWWLVGDNGDGYFISFVIRRFYLRLVIDTHPPTHKHKRQAAEAAAGGVDFKQRAAHYKALLEKGKVVGCMFCF